MYAPFTVVPPTLTVPAVYRKKLFKTVKLIAKGLNSLAKGDKKGVPMKEINKLLNDESFDINAESTKATSSKGTRRRKSSTKGAKASKNSKVSSEATSTTRRRRSRV